MAPPAQCPTSSPLGFVWESVVPPSLPFPHHFATFLCYAWRGFLFPHLCFSSFPSFLLHTPTHIFPALSNPQKWAPQPQDQVGNVKATCRTGGCPIPSSLAMALVFICCCGHPQAWAFPSLWASAMQVPQCTGVSQLPTFAPSIPPTWNAIPPLATWSPPSYLS